jgi:hypothetical protein
LINDVLQNNDIVSLDRAFPMTLNSLPSAPVEDIDSTLYATQANIVELNAKLNRAYFSIDAIGKMKRQRR